MSLRTDWKRGKLLDYWVQKCTDEEITEEQMESKMDRLADMAPDQIDREYNRRIRGR